MPRKGTKKRKTRTHVKPNASSADPTAAKVPKSFVVKSGDVGTSVAQLTRDMRKVLEPNTGSRIKERKSNRLRDYVSMSGPLGVTHLLVFSQPPTPTSLLAEKDQTEEERKKLIDSTTTVNFRLIRLPRGPTLSFKVLRYSLASDVLRMARRPQSQGREFAEGPLLILSGFGGEDKQLKLMTTVFQNLFPAIHVQTMPLASARRVVLLSYNPATKTIEFRHYLISVRPVGVSKPIRKIILGSTSNSSQARKRSLGEMIGSSGEESVSENDDDDGDAAAPSSGRKEKAAAGKGKDVLDLGRVADISDYILNHSAMGYQSSDSEGSQSGYSSSEGGSEDDEKKGKVRLGADYVGRGNRKGEKRAVRLRELGPRMELGLVKVEEGVGEGEVLFHEIVHKSVSEATQLARTHAAKRKLQAERRAQQAANVAAKKAANGETVEGDDEKEEEDDEDKIDSDIEYDYDEEHGLLPGSDEELDGSEADFSDEEEGDEDEDVSMGAQSSEDGSDDEAEQILGEDTDDSDTDPIPVSAASTSFYPKPSSSKSKGPGPMSFKHKSFVKQDRGAPKKAIGIAAPKAKSKKEVKRDQEAERKEGKKLGSTGAKGSFSAKGGFEKDEERGRGGPSRGRGADRGGRGRGGDRGGRGGGRGGGSSRGGRGGGRGKAS